MFKELYDINLEIENKCNKIKNYYNYYIKIKDVAYLSDFKWYISRDFDTMKYVLRIIFFDNLGKEYGDAFIAEEEFLTESVAYMASKINPNNIHKEIEEFID